ncbi:MAG: hypothetical protein AAFU61_10110 [Pseudomonadota bacterium]
MEDMLPCKKTKDTATPLAANRPVVDIVRFMARAAAERAWAKTQTAAADTTGDPP